MQKPNSYGLLSCLLLIIVMILIAYIAYDKGLEKSKEVKTTTTITTTTKEVIKEEVKDYFTYEEVCLKEDCNTEITTTKINDAEIKISLESTTINEEFTHKIIISGNTEKTISLNKFISLKAVDNKYFIIKHLSEGSIEEGYLTLYDLKFNKLDELKINLLNKEEYKNLEVTYYTFPEECLDTTENYYTKVRSVITEEGFLIINTTKDKLKEEGFTC